MEIIIQMLSFLGVGAMLWCVATGIDRNMEKLDKIISLLEKHEKDAHPRT